jgi:cytochrome P450
MRDVAAHRRLDAASRPPIDEVARDFAHHDEHLDDVFTTYRRLRADCPVGRSDHYGGFWFLAGYDDIYRAEQRPDDFSVQPSMLLPSIGQDRPLIPLDVDPPMLQKYRRIMLPAFSPKEMDRAEPMVRSVANGVLDGLEGREGFDASLKFARPFPMTVFAVMAGLPTEDLDRFGLWVERLFYERTTDFEETKRTAAEVCRYFGALRERRLGEPPRDDLIGRLLTADIDGRPLTEDEFIDYAFLLAAAGLDTTSWALRASFWHLATHPDDRRRLVEHPEMIPSATEEFLRCLSPVQAMARTLKHDVEVGDRSIPAGQRILLLFGSGNRDERVFNDPDTVRIDRVDNPHLAFGVGGHRCLGSNLARREMVIGLGEFLRRFPEFEIPYGVTTVWHGVGPLPVAIGGTH